MSRGAKVKLHCTLEEAIEAMRTLGTQAGWKVTDNLSEFGSYYPPEHYPGGAVTPHLAVINPNVPAATGAQHSGSKTRHYGNVKTKGLLTEIPMDVWCNGFVIGIDEKGEVVAWTDNGSGGGESRTEKLSAEHQKMIEMLNAWEKKQNPDAKPLSGYDLQDRIANAEMLLIVAGRKIQKRFPSVTVSHIKDLAMGKPLNIEVESTVKVKIDTAKQTKETEKPSMVVPGPRKQDKSKLVR